MNLHPVPKSIFQAAIGTAVAQLTTTTGIAANAGIDVFAHTANSVAIFIGHNSSVSTAVGFMLIPGARKRFLSADPSRLYTIAAAASQVASVSCEDTT